GLNLTRELRRRDPSLQVIVITAYGSVRKAMEATKGAGAFHVLEKPFDPDELLGLVRSALDHRRLVVENTNLRRRLADRAADSEILGQAPGIQRVLETVAAVADADANVLIIGESGTGKELVADALHERSRRRGGPWVKINCGALPPQLVDEPEPRAGPARGPPAPGPVLPDQHRLDRRPAAARAPGGHPDPGPRVPGALSRQARPGRRGHRAGGLPEAALLRMARQRPRAPERARARGARDSWTADHPRGSPRAVPGRGHRARGGADGRTLRSARRLARGDRACLHPARVVESPDFPRLCRELPRHGGCYGRGREGL